MELEGARCGLQTPSLHAMGEPERKTWLLDEASSSMASQGLESCLGLTPCQGGNSPGRRRAGRMADGGSPAAPVCVVTSATAAHAQPLSGCCRQPGVATLSFTGATHIPGLTRRRCS